MWQCHCLHHHHIIVTPNIIIITVEPKKKKLKKGELFVALGLVENNVAGNRMEKEPSRILCGVWSLHCTTFYFFCLFFVQADKNFIVIWPSSSSVYCDHIPASSNTKSISIYFFDLRWHHPMMPFTKCENRHHTYSYFVYIPCALISLLVLMIRFYLINFRISLFYSSLLKVRVSISLLWVANNNQCDTH